jgi:hypothetical protein
MKISWWNQCGWSTEESAGRTGAEGVTGVSGPGMNMELEFRGEEMPEERGVEPMLSGISGASSGESNILSEGLELLFAICSKLSLEGISFSILLIGF